MSESSIDKSINLGAMSEALNDKADRDLGNTDINKMFSEMTELWSGWQSAGSWVTLPLAQPYTNFKFLIICYGTGSTTNHDICQTVLFVPMLRFLSSNTSTISDYGNFCYGHGTVYIRLMVDDTTYPDHKSIKVWASGTGLKYIYGVI